MQVRKAIQQQMSHQIFPIRSLLNFTPPIMHIKGTRASIRRRMMEEKIREDSQHQSKLMRRVVVNHHLIV